jgi:hypothetical protein
MQDHVWLPVTGVLVIAAITPGPNNFMVMEASARGGAAAAGSVVLGVVLGSLGLLSLVSVGVGSLSLEELTSPGSVPHCSFVAQVHAPAMIRTVCRRRCGVLPCSSS